jgi:putative DNA primase/helicase
MSFLTIATPFINIGIPVFPLSPASKVPIANIEWLTAATTDPAKIAVWNDENPDYNVALVAGDYCFLEFDQLGIRSAAEEMGESVPITRTQKSGSGGGHFIFKSTDRARAMGNRSANRDGHEWFSFRICNKYLVGGGSIHPNGNFYKTVTDVEPIPVPDWICDFVEKHTETAKPKPKDALSVSDEFDFDDFCEHYGITIAGVRDEVWHVVEECPGVGYRHENSTLTAFYWDGNSLGWSCFAQECPTHGLSIGQLISFLNRTHDPYKGIIWDTDDSDLDGVDNLDFIPDGKVLWLLKAEPTPSLEEPQSEHIVEQTLPDADPLPVEAPKDDLDGMRYASYIENDDFNSGLLIKSADKYVMTELTWLWPQKIPKGKVIFFTGKPDCGKSLTAADVIARVTTGSNWPDGSKNTTPPSRVLLAASEDDPNDTLVPRLMAAGADLSKVELVVGTIIETKQKNKPKRKRRTNLDLKRDCKHLLETLKNNPDIALLVLDPISSFFGAGADQNKDADIRPVMDEITKMCSKSGLTVIGLIHSNKRSDVDAMGKVSGATALAASVRAVWGFGKDAEDRSLYHMSHVKGNLAKEKSGLNYTIVGVPVNINGMDVEVPRIVWGEKCEMDADDLLKEERSKKDAKDFKAEAAKILIKAQRFPVQAKRLYELAESQGISGTTMKNARESLSRDGFVTVAKKHEGVWWWHMADEPTRVNQSIGEETFVAEDML